MAAPDQAEEKTATLGVGEKLPDPMDNDQPGIIHDAKVQRGVDHTRTSAEGRASLQTAGRRLSFEAVLL